MQALTRNSFIKALIATTALPQVAVGENPELDKTIHSPKEGVSAADAAAIMDKYGLIPVKGQPGTFDFLIGGKRYRYGFISNISLWGIVFPTRERYRAIMSHQSACTLQAVRVEGEWNYPYGSAFPRDFQLKEFADAVDLVFNEVCNIGHENFGEKFTDDTEKVVIALGFKKKYDTDWHSETVN